MFRPHPFLGDFPEMLANIYESFLRYDRSMVVRPTAQDWIEFVDQPLRVSFVGFRNITDAIFKFVYRLTTWFNQEDFSATFFSFVTLVFVKTNILP